VENQHIAAERLRGERWEQMRQSKIGTLNRPPVPASRQGRRS
jgi:hypothetical protein